MDDQTEKMSESSKALNNFFFKRFRGDFGNNVKLLNKPVVDERENALDDDDERGAVELFGAKYIFDNVYDDNEGGMEEGNVDYGVFDDDSCAGPAGAQGGGGGGGGGKEGGGRGAKRW